MPPTQRGYAPRYLWEDIWARDSVLDLVRQFIHEVEEEDERGRKTGKRFLIFPRYQQLDAVRKAVADAREHGPGRRYLIQHIRTRFRANPAASGEMTSTSTAPCQDASGLALR